MSQEKPKFDWQMFRYDLNLPAAITALATFSLLSALLIRQYWKTRNHISIWVIIGATCEVGGYGGRIWAHYNSKGWGPFIVQGTLILTGPLFFAATIYMMLGRTIRLAKGDDISLIKPKWCTRIFVGADVSTLMLQGLGASIMGTRKLALALAGEKIVIASLALQVTAFMAFVIVGAHFHVRMNEKSRSVGIMAKADWRRMLWILASVSSLILLRCVYRLIEYSTGNTSYLHTHEWPLYVFDAVPMALVLALMLVLQPMGYIHLESNHARCDSEAQELTTMKVTRE